jgi:isoaspartyl peptidase/L-asparaginase-like protein (Ntn-hydrolase superfamily)
MTESQKQHEPAVATDKKEWQLMTLTTVGTVGNLVQQGGGKLSAATGDPGEPRKTPSKG